MDWPEKLNIQGVEIRHKINLERYTTIKLANTGSIAIVKSLDALRNLIQKLNNLSARYHLVGWGSNQVLHHCDDTLFIKLDFAFDRNLLKEKKERYDLPASVPINSMSSAAIKLGLKGWEVFTGIPASLGGAIFMNAGTSLGEISELVESVTVLRPTGEVYIYETEELKFSYRKNHFIGAGEIIVSAVLRHKGFDNSLGQQINDYLDYRKNTQPLTTKNCGSVFKNLENFRAGQTIDSLGLKGFGSENIIVSYKHANFIENIAEASSEDFKLLIERLKEEIERFSGLEFELEVKIY